MIFIIFQFSTFLIFHINLTTFEEIFNILFWCKNAFSTQTCQSAECGRFHRWLVADFTIGVVGMRWSVVWKGIGWSTKKILERIGQKFQKSGTLDKQQLNNNSHVNTICVYISFQYLSILRWSWVMWEHFVGFETIYFSQ